MKKEQNNKGVNKEIFIKKLQKRVLDITDQNTVPISTIDKK